VSQSTIHRSRTTGSFRDFTAIARALGRGQLVVDRVFDEVFPANARQAARVHWTPVEVAMRAARLLGAKPNATILDVGSGVGNFCIVAAAALPGAHVRGIEHRYPFVAIAREAAKTIGVDVDFTHGTFDAHDPGDVDGIYLFNPFAENLSSPEDRLDESVELGERRFWRDIESAERLLRAARVGTRVVTYCGWGGSMPREYRLALRESRVGTLELWVKSDHAELRSDPLVDGRMPIGAATLDALRARAAAAGVATVWDGE
jgi:SAM-dependent methyltransferase